MSEGSHSDTRMPQSLFLRKEEVQQLMSDNRMTQKELLLSLVRSGGRSARAPISKFHVSAAGLGVSGAVYIGINLEFPGVPITNSVHAEQFVVMNAVQHGESELLYLAINAGPCGHCRQFLAELHNADDLRLVFENDASKEWRLDELLPQRFRPQDVLGKDFGALLMKSVAGDTYQLTKKSLEILDRAPERPSLRKAAEQSLMETRQCYVPYSNCPASVALVLKNDKIFTGCAVENNAYNPTVPPLQSAIIRAISTGSFGDYNEIDCVVLMELDARPIVSYVDTTAAVIKAISPDAQFIVLKIERSELE